MTPDYVEGKSQEYRPGPGIYIIGGIIFAFIGVVCAIEIMCHPRQSIRKLLKHRQQPRGIGTLVRPYAAVTQEITPREPQRTLSARQQLAERRARNMAKQARRRRT